MEETIDKFLENVFQEFNKNQEKKQIEKIEKIESFFLKILSEHGLKRIEDFDLRKNNNLLNLIYNYFDNEWFITNLRFLELIINEKLKHLKTILYLIIDEKLDKTNKYLEEILNEYTKKHVIKKKIDLKVKNEIDMVNKIDLDLIEEVTNLKTNFKMILKSWIYDFINWTYIIKNKDILDDLLPLIQDFKINDSFVNSTIRINFKWININVFSINYPKTSELINNPEELKKILEHYSFLKRSIKKILDNYKFIIKYIIFKKLKETEQERAEIKNIVDYNLKILNTKKVIKLLPKKIEKYLFNKLKKGEDNYDILFEDKIKEIKNYDSDIANIRLYLNKDIDIIFNKYWFKNLFINSVNNIKQKFNLNQTSIDNIFITKALKTKLKKYLEDKKYNKLIQEIQTKYLIEKENLEIN